MAYGRTRTDERGCDEKDRNASVAKLAAALATAQGKEER